MDRQDLKEALSRILREDYAPLLRWTGLVETWFADDMRWSAQSEDGRRVSVVAHRVGPRNSGTYRGWYFVTREAWQALRSPKPDIFDGYTLMVGMTPDGQDVWWHVLYRDSVLAGLEAYSVKNDRMRRIPYSMLTSAAVAPIADCFQTTWVKPEGGI